LAETPPRRLPLRIAAESRATRTLPPFANPHHPDGAEVRSQLLTGSRPERQPTTVRMDKRIGLKSLFDMQSCNFRLD
jgi:hypothetical protein